MVETDDEKQPKEASLGKRLVSESPKWPHHLVSGIWNYEHADQLNGHVNRNIRLAYSFIQMLDPFLQVLSVRKESDSKVTVFWTVTGCANYIDQAYTVDGKNREMHFWVVGDRHWQCNL